MAPAATTTLSAGTTSPSTSRTPTARRLSNTTRSTGESARRTRLSRSSAGQSDDLCRRDPTTVPAGQWGQLRRPGPRRAAPDPPNRARHRRPAPREARARPTQSSTSLHPHERYSSGSPRNATIALIVDEPPTPRPRRYGAGAPPPTRVAVNDSYVRPGTSSAATKSGPPSTPSRSAGRRSGPASSSVTERSGSSDRRPATTHPAEPAPTTTHRCTGERFGAHHARMVGQNTQDFGRCADIDVGWTTPPTPSRGLLAAFPRRRLHRPRPLPRTLHGPVRSARPGRCCPRWHPRSPARRRSPPTHSSISTSTSQLPVRRSRRPRRGGFRRGVSWLLDPGDARRVGLRRRDVRPGSRRSRHRLRRERRSGCAARVPDGGRCTGSGAQRNLRGCRSRTDSEEPTRTR